MPLNRVFYALSKPRTKYDLLKLSNGSHFLYASQLSTYNIPSVFSRVRFEADFFPPSLEMDLDALELFLVVLDPILHLLLKLLAERTLTARCRRMRAMLHGRSIPLKGKTATVNDKEMY